MGGAESHVANAFAPIHREIIAPIQREVFAPIQREVLDPIQREVLDPINRVVVEPIQREVFDPIQREVLDPINHAIIEPIVDTVVKPVIDLFVPPSHSVVIEKVQDPSLGGLIELTLAEQQRLADELLRLQDELNETAEDEEGEPGAISMKKIFKLAKKIPPRELHGTNIALFGINGTGKSSIVNAFTDTSAAPVGPTNSTSSITAYQGSNYTIFDLPGLNDDVSYFGKDYISLLKGVSHRLVVVTATVKQVKKLINLFEYLNLSYDIVVNKFDQIDVDGRQEFQDKIKEEANLPEWKHLHRVWFVSAAQPTQFSDWLQLIHYLTT